MLSIFGLLQLYTFFRIGSNLFSCFYPPSADSEAGPVLNAGAWGATNFSLLQVVEIMQFIVDGVKEIRCPCSPLCIADNLCAAVVNGVAKVMDAIIFPMRTVRVGRPNSSSESNVFFSYKELFLLYTDPSCFGIHHGRGMRHRQC
jgi:hypothetical protein